VITGLHFIDRMQQNFVTGGGKQHMEDVRLPEIKDLACEVDLILQVPATSTTKLSFTAPERPAASATER
jgi:hypothetical protein